MMSLWLKSALSTTLLGSALVLLLLGVTNAGTITLSPQGSLISLAAYIVIMILAWPFMITAITLGLQLFGTNATEYATPILLAAIVITILWLFALGAILGWMLTRLKRK